MINLEYALLLVDRPEPNQSWLRFPPFLAILAWKDDTLSQDPWPTLVTELTLGTVIWNSEQIFLKNSNESHMFFLSWIWFLSRIRTLSCYLVKSDDSRISLKIPLKLQMALPVKVNNTTTHMGYLCKGNLRKKRKALCILAMFGILGF